MNPRLRRLQADYEQVQRVLAQHPRLRLLGVQGNPPDRYSVEFHVRSLVPVGDAGFQEGTTHRAEIFLPMDYPRRPPFCRMTSPVYHPNIDPQKICIGDHWSAGQSLVLLIVRIAEMLTYQSYNVQSPLNAKAAAWAAQNISRLPLEAVDLTVGL